MHVIGRNQVSARESGRRGSIAPAPRLMAMVLVLAGFWGRAALAHEGPPFPIIVEEDVGPYRVSVWTDPDIGTGTFFIVLEPRGDQELPADTEVLIGVRPKSGRLEEVVYRAEPQDVRYGQRHFAEVAFDQGEMWQIRVVVSGPEGGGELHAEVEATPDGVIGPIGLLVYALPFLAVGFLWLKAMLRRRAVAQEDTIQEGSHSG